MTITPTPARAAPARSAQGQRPGDRRVRVSRRERTFARRVASALRRLIAR